MSIAEDPVIIDNKAKAQYMSMIVRQNCKRIMREKGVQQQDMAHRIGMNPASFSQMLNGNKRLLFEDIYLVSEGLGVSLQELMDPSKIQGEMQEQAESLLKSANMLNMLKKNKKAAGVAPAASDGLPRLGLNQRHSD